MRARLVYLSLCGALLTGCAFDEADFVDETDFEPEVAEIQLEAKKKPKSKTIVDCESDYGEHRVRVRKEGKSLKLYVYANGKVIHRGKAKKRTIEKSSRVTRIGYKSSRADLRIRTRDKRIEHTEGSAHLTMKDHNDRLWCSKY